MARARRDLRAQVDIWPGFVDALSTLLLVFIFLLVAFVLAQSFMSRMIAGKDETVTRLETTVAELNRLLFLEKATGEELRRDVRGREAEIATVTAERDNAFAAADRLTAERDAARGEARTVADEARAAAARRDQLASGLAALRQESVAVARARDATRGELAAARDALREREARLAALGGDLSGTRRSLTEQERLSAEAAAQVAALNEQVILLRDQLLSIEAALDLERRRVETQNARIGDLGNRLNLALAQRVEELSRFRSDFFGRLREVLGDRPGVRVVGDRFVFQSEVLFNAGNDQIDAAGQAQIAALGDTLKRIAATIPKELPWVLQINGHTDRRPIASARFPSNWELSTARAINVAKLLAAEGVPADRLAAAGFAEFQPLDPGATEDALRRNRRIEIKLTTR